MTREPLSCIIGIMMITILNSNLIRPNSSRLNILGKSKIVLINPSPIPKYEIKELLILCLITIPIFVLVPREFMMPLRIFYKVINFSCRINQRLRRVSIVSIDF